LYGREVVIRDEGRGFLIVILSWNEVEEKDPPDDASMDPSPSSSTTCGVRVRMTGSSMIITSP